MLKLDTKLYWTVAVLCLIAFTEVQGQFFNQDFESSTTVADYSAATPSRWQVDHLGNNNINVTHQTNPHRLRFQRANNNGQAAYARTTDIAGVGSGLTALMVRFDIRGFNFPATAREVMILQLGNGFNNNNAAEGTGKIFAEVTIHSTTTASRFRVGNAGTAIGSNSSADNARITIAANKSGADVFYAGPDGTRYTLATGRMDVWLGNSREITGADISGTSETTVTNFKFRFDYGLLDPAKIELDDISLFPLYAAGEGMSGNYTVGRGTLAAHTSQFTSLTRNGGGFFEVLNFSDAIAGSMNFRVMTDITLENGANALNQLTGMSAANPIEIQPDGTTMRTIRSNAYNGPANQGLIRLNGADHVIFDGRAPTENGTGSSIGRYLTVRYQQDNNNPTFHFSNDASNNTLQYSIIEGRDTDQNRGVVMFGNGTVTGNDHNLVEYCDVKDSNGTPRNGIISRNTGVGFNDDGIIRFCNVFNIHNTSGIIGIGMLTATSGWTIQGNSVYQEVARTYSGTPRIPAIYLNTTGDGFQIIDNFMGGSSPACGGSAWTANVVIGGGIDMPRLWGISNFGGTLGTARQTIIRGNTFSNFINNAEGNAGQDFVAGVHMFAGNVLVENNRIGSISTSGNITLNAFNTGGANFRIYGIYVTNNVTGEILNNEVGGMTVNILNATLTNDNATVHGIHIEGAMFCAENRIGSTTVGNSLTIVSPSNTGTISGIHVAGIGGEVSANEIRGLSNLSPSLLTQTSGISINTTTGSADLKIDGNRIFGITGTAASIVGIRIGQFNNDLTLSNNMISMGVGNNNDRNLIGILNNTSNAARLNVVYNTIYLGGTVMMGGEDTYCFYRGNNSTTPVFIYNNVFQNTRTGGMGRHFAIGSDVNTNWGANFNDCESSKNFINHNAYYVSTVGQMARLAGTNYDFAGWQGLGFEANGVNLNPGGAIAFTNVDTAQLYKSSAAELRLNGKAYPLLTSVNPDLPTVLHDIDDEPRIGPDLGADEDLVTFTATTDGTWGDPATWGSAIIPSYGDIVVIPAGRTVTIPTGIDQYYYQLQVEGTLELQGTANLFGCFSDAFGGTTSLASTGALNMAPGSSLGLASSLTDHSGQPFNGTVDFNINAIPPPLSCFLSNYIEALNAQTNTVSLLGTAPNSTIQRINLLNTGVLVLEKQLTAGVDPTGILNLNDGQIALNNRLLIAGDLAETAGTFTGGPAAALSIVGTGNLTGTLKVDNTGLQELLLNRAGKGVVTLGQDLVVTQSLVLTEGIIDTESFLVNATDAAVSGTADGHVMGRLRRNVVTGTPLAFPVGSSLQRNQATVTFTDLAGLQWVTASFDPDYAGATITSITDNSVEYVQACQGGRWTLIPNDYVPAVYTLALEGTEVSCLGSAQTIAKISGTTADFSNSVHSSANSRTGFVGFTSFVFLSDFVPLPLTLLQFTARLAGPAVRIAWETAAERGVGYFAVERSTDGRNFTEIARREAHNLQGTHGYEHLDATWKALPKSPDVLYYRLRYLDEGTIRYTQVITVGLQSTSATLVVFPNPSQGELYVALGAPAQWVNVQLMDLAGKTLSKESFVQPGELLAVPGFQQLPKGIYLVVVQSPSGRQTCKIVRE